MTIFDIQTMLARLGYRPGPLDGAWGRQTAAAVRAFQKDRGLDDDGVVGPITLAALRVADGQKPADDLPPLVWYAEAARQHGTPETPGPASNRKILQWASDRGIPYASDDIPWCGLFVAHCVGATLPREPLPGNPLGARNWSRFGIPSTPARGAVLVFWRKSRQSGLGHVGFYAGEDAGAFCVLGGNQSDQVSLAWIAKNRLVGARWPASVPPPVDARPTKLARNNAKLSIAEA